jgi:hypothetical protein
MCSNKSEDTSTKNVQNIKHNNTKYKHKNVKYKNNFICTCIYSGLSYKQGRRKLRKVGGAAGLEGHFSEKKGHLKIIFGDLSPPPSPHRQKNFGQCTILGVKKIFRT